MISVRKDDIFLQIYVVTDPSKSVRFGPDTSLTGALILGDVDLEASEPPVMANPAAPETGPFDDIHKVTHDAELRQNISNNITHFS